MGRSNKEPKLVAVRLDPHELEIVGQLQRSGSAKTVSEAIRYALNLAATEHPRRLAVEARQADAVRDTEPVEIEMLPGGGLINVILGDRQRVLARVLARNGKAVLPAEPISWRVDPPQLARVERQGDATFVIGLKEGKGVITAEAGRLSQHSFLDVWRQIHSGRGEGRISVGGTRVFPR